MNNSHYTDAAQAQAIIRELAAKPSDLSTLTQLQTELEQARRRIAALEAENDALRKHNDELCHARDVWYTSERTHLQQRIAVLKAERQTLRSALTNIAVLPVYELDIAYSIANAALEQTDAT